jgi:hypothetical protein
MSPEYWQKKAERAQFEAAWWARRCEYLGDSLVEIEQTLLEEIVRLRAERDMPRKSPWELP